MLNHPWLQMKEDYEYRMDKTELTEKIIERKEAQQEQEKEPVQEMADVGYYLDELNEADAEDDPYFEESEEEDESVEYIQDPKFKRDIAQG